MSINLVFKGANWSLLTVIQSQRFSRSELILLARTWINWIEWRGRNGVLSDSVSLHEYARILKQLTLFSISVDIYSGFRNINLHFESRVKSHINLSVCYKSCSCLSVYRGHCSFLMQGKCTSTNTTQWSGRRTAGFPGFLLFLCICFTYCFGWQHIDWTLRLSCGGSSDAS